MKGNGKPNKWKKSNRGGSTRYASRFLIARLTCQPLLTLLTRMFAKAEEAKKTKGPPVTPANFLAWRKKFEAEMKVRKEAELEASIKGLPPKEREEAKRYNSKLTGK